MTTTTLSSAPLTSPPSHGRRMVAFMYRLPPSKRWVRHSIHNTHEAAWRAGCEFKAKVIELWFPEVEEEQTLHPVTSDASGVSREVPSE